LSYSLTAKLGTDSGANPRTTHNGTQGEVDVRRTWPAVDNDKDFFVEQNGVKFAGTHLLIDLWGASRLDELDTVGAALRECAEAAGATILHCHLHHFTPNGGISGVLVLAESHISIHSWPERGYAALDVFMCGACDPYKAIPVLKRVFAPINVTLGEQKRGLMP
jgi:S-adenosylmethionine decarboxylase